MSSLRELHLNCINCVKFFARSECVSEVKRLSFRSNNCIGLENLCLTGKREQNINKIIAIEDISFKEFREKYSPNDSPTADNSVTVNGKTNKHAFYQKKIQSRNYR